MKALLDVTVRSFHYRQSLDACVSAIARLDSYEKSPTTRKDTPIKVRQDLLATADVITLALHLRRFAEITRSTGLLKSTQLAAHVLESRGGRADPGVTNVSLDKVVGQIIHSNTCVVCRNGVHLCLHFDVRSIPSALVEGEFATKAVLIVESDRPKRFFFLQEFLESSWSLINAFAEKNKDVKAYIEKRSF